MQKTGKKLNPCHIPIYVSNGKKSKHCDLLNYFEKVSRNKTACSSNSQNNQLYHSKASKQVSVNQRDNYNKEYESSYSSSDDLYLGILANISEQINAQQDMTIGTANCFHKAFGL